MSVGSLLHPGSRNPLYHSRRPFEGFVLYGELFFFSVVALFHCSLCATGDHHIKTPLFMFSAPEAALFFKRRVIFF